MMAQLDSEPTPYPELNAVLVHFLEGAGSALNDNLIGAYLQGSFAIGDFSEYSDCDFIIVIQDDLSPAELHELGKLHLEIHDLPHEYWRTRLEGSYAPASILRRWSTVPRDPKNEPRSESWADPGILGSPPRAYPFWYLDHGSNHLVRSEHDNSQVVRWCLREKGVVLTGPDPRSLIDPVSEAALRVEVRESMDRWLATGLSMPMIAWQVFWVGLFCRILYTLEMGVVESKKVSMSWARDTLGPEWTGLIIRAQELRRGDSARSTQPADPRDIEATHAFAMYCASYSTGMNGSRQP